MCVLRECRRELRSRTSGRLCWCLSAQSECPKPLRAQKSLAATHAPCQPQLGPRAAATAAPRTAPFRRIQSRRQNGRKTVQTRTRRCSWPSDTAPAERGRAYEQHSARQDCPFYVAKPLFQAHRPAQRQGCARQQDAHGSGMQAHRLIVLVFAARQRASAQDDRVKRKAAEGHTASTTARMCAGTAQYPSDPSEEAHLQAGSRNTIMTRDRRQSAGAPASARAFEASSAHANNLITIGMQGWSSGGVNWCEQGRATEIGQYGAGRPKSKWRTEGAPRPWPARASGRRGRRQGSCRYRPQHCAD